MTHFQNFSLVPRALDPQNPGRCWPPPPGGTAVFAHLDPVSASPFDVDKDLSKFDHLRAAAVMRGAVEIKLISKRRRIYYSTQLPTLCSLRYETRCSKRTFSWTGPVTSVQLSVIYPCAWRHTDCWWLYKRVQVPPARVIPLAFILICPANYIISRMAIDDVRRSRRSIQPKTGYLREPGVHFLLG